VPTSRNSQPREQKHHIPALRKKSFRALTASGLCAAALALVVLPLDGSAAASSSVGPTAGQHQSSQPATPAPPTNPILPTLPVFSVPAGNPHTTAHPPKSAAPPVAKTSFSAPATVIHRKHVAPYKPPPPLPSVVPVPASTVCLANGRPVTHAGGDLDLPGVPGSSTDPGHAGALPISSAGPTAMLPPQIDSSSLGQLVVLRTLDKDSPGLAMAASTGERFGCVHLELGSDSTNGYATVEYALSDAAFLDETVAAGVETLTLTYATIQWTYTTLADGVVHHGSGAINAYPTQLSTAVASGSRLLVWGVAGLTGLVAAGLLLLYALGRRRSRRRYVVGYVSRLEPPRVAGPQVVAEPQVAEPVWLEAPDQSSPVGAAAEVHADAEGEESAEDTDIDPSGADLVEPAVSPVLADGVEVEVEQVQSELVPEAVALEAEQPGEPAADDQGGDPDVRAETVEEEETIEGETTEAEAVEEAAVAEEVESAQADDEDDEAEEVESTTTADQPYALPAAERGA
jgi:type VI protein secretion system component Hcp